MRPGSDQQVQSHGLLAGDLWPGFQFDLSATYRRFFGNARMAFKRLLEGIILHGHVTVPTESYLSFTALIDVLGEGAVLDLLDAGILRFVRINRALAYTGNGAGLKFFEIADPNGRTQPYFGPIGEAIDWAVSGLNRPISNPAIKVVAARATQEINVDDHLNAIKHETYTDILEDPYLHGLFALRNSNMDRLSGIAPNQVKTYEGVNPNTPNDEIELVLSLARTNLEMLLAAESGCADCSTIMAVGHLIKSKMRRHDVQNSGVEEFAVLREIADIPDLGEAVLNKELGVRDIINLRDSRHYRGFREWFHQNCRTDPITTAREYSQMVQRLSAVQSFPGRVLRFIVTSALGVVGSPAVAASASVIDSFFLEKWFRGASPKFFIKDLQQVGRRTRKT